MTAMINKLPMLPHSPLSESPGVPLQATESFVGILRSPREGGEYYASLDETQHLSHGWYFLSI